MEANMTTTGSKAKGKIGVLIEDHFDETEFRRFNEFFPANGYEVEYISHLWNQDYKGILLIGAYAMDRLRYEEHPQEGQPNQSPAVRFLRTAVKAMDANKLKIGTICHSLWLFCAAPELLKNRKVTCAHNLIYDVQNAGGIVVFDGDGTKKVHIDGNLITGKHPNVVDEFMNVFLEAVNEQELEKVST
jgi:protease I